MTPTPEERANALIIVYLSIMDVDYNSAKRCALICVDEIIVTLKKLNPQYEEKTYWHPIDYWKEVKHIIQNK